MKKTFYPVCLALFTILIIFAKSQVLSQPTKNAPITLTIKSVRFIIAEDDPTLLINLTIKNISKEKISINAANLENTFFYGGCCRIVNSKKEEIPWDAWSTKVERPIRRKEDYLILEPGQSKTFEIDIYRGMNKHLSQDTYTFSCSYYGTDDFYENKILKKVEYPWTGTIVSNDETISISGKAITGPC